MQVFISGQNFDIGRHFRTHIEDVISKNVKKLFEHAISVHVVVTRDGDEFSVEIVVNEGEGKGVAVTKCRDSDAYISFNMAAKTMENKLRKHKKRLRSHRDRKKIGAFLATEQLVSIDNFDDDYDNSDDNECVNVCDVNRFDKEANNDGVELTADLISLSNKQFSVEIMDVDDAIMYMELKDMPTYIFVNPETHNLNMIYRRKDGHIVWVDTTLKVNADNFVNI